MMEGDDKSRVQSVRQKARGTAAVNQKMENDGGDNDVVGGWDAVIVTQLGEGAYLEISNGGQETARRTRYFRPTAQPHFPRRGGERMTDAL